MKRRSRFMLAFAVAAITAITLHATVGHRHHQGWDHRCEHNDHYRAHCDDQADQQEKDDHQ